jgi:hypothetical protein
VSCWAAWSATSSLSSSTASQRRARSRVRVTSQLQVPTYPLQCVGSVPVPDPDLDPPDPRVFWPLGSRSTSQRYGSGSGSFYHHAKIILSSSTASQRRAKSRVRDMSQLQVLTPYLTVLWIRINLSCWIWIRIQEGKNDSQKEKKVQNFHVLKCWMFSF